MSNEEFEIIDTKTKDEEPIIISATSSTFEKLQKEYSEYKKIMMEDIEKTSDIFSDSSSSSSTLTRSTINTMATSSQDDVSKIKQINSYARLYINKNDLIGKTYDAISNNVNNNIKLSYDFSDLDEDYDGEKMKDAKAVIKDFNKQVNIKRIIEQAIPTTYAEGNYICYLSGDSNNGWCIDYFPLGIVEISQYSMNGDPIVLLNIDELKSAIKPPSIKGKNNKYLFYEKVDEVIKSNYPQEVYDAFKNKSTYAKLDYKRTGVVRIGNQMGKYGVTPLLRAFTPLLDLETYESSDSINANAKAKKIIWQKMREKTDDISQTDINAQTLFAHSQLISAWKNKTVVYTSSPWVESVEYVEPKTESTNINTLNYHRNKVFTTLGISYLRDTSTSVTSGKLSVDELVKTINRIASSVSDMIRKFYQTVLEENGVETTYTPLVKVVDSEQMELELKKEISTYLFQILGCSYTTAYEIMGINIEDEKKKRQEENSNGYADIFVARSTGYTTSGDVTNTDDKESGRPENNNENDPQKEEKQNKDKERNNI